MKAFTNSPSRQIEELVESENATAKSQASSLAGPLQVTIEECLERCQPFLSDHPTT